MPVTTTRRRSSEHELIEAQFGRKHPGIRALLRQLNRTADIWPTLFHTITSAAKREEWIYGVIKPAHIHKSQPEVLWIKIGYIDEKSKTQFRVS